MPWQAQLFIGQRVHNYDEVCNIFQRIDPTFTPLDTASITDPTKLIETEDKFYSDLFVDKVLSFKNTSINIRIFFTQEHEGGCGLPVPVSDNYSDAAVCFGLTERYTTGILHPNEESRPEPFEFEPQDLIDILQDVRQWWPDAKAMIWDIFY